MMKVRIYVAIAMVKTARLLVRLSYRVAGHYVVADWEKELRTGRVH